LVVIDYDFLVRVVMETHNQELPPNSQVNQPNPTFEPKLVRACHNVPLSKNTK